MFQPNLQMKPGEFKRKVWPSLEGWVGTVDDITKETTFPHTFKGFVGMSGSICRVYGDEIELAEDRIKAARYRHFIEWSVSQLLYI